jgi:hypothetical protein
MRNRAEEIRSQLEAEWPGWQVWIIWRAVGGPLWCARRRECSALQSGSEARCSAAPTVDRGAEPGTGAAPRPAGKLGPQPGTARRRCHASASLAGAVPSVSSVGGRPRRSWGLTAPRHLATSTDADPAGAGIIRAAAGPSAAQPIRALLKPPPRQERSTPMRGPRVLLLAAAAAGVLITGCGQSGQPPSTAGHGGQATGQVRVIVCSVA